MISFVVVLPGIWLVVKKLHDLPLMSILSGRKNIDYDRILFSFVYGEQQSYLWFYWIFNLTRKL